jgi:hypothetical protein
MSSSNDLNVKFRVVHDVVLVQPSVVVDELRVGGQMQRLRSRGCRA